MGQVRLPMQLVGSRDLYTFCYLLLLALRAYHGAHFYLHFVLAMQIVVRSSFSGTPLYSTTICSQVECIEYSLYLRWNAQCTHAILQSHRRLQTSAHVTYSNMHCLSCARTVLQTVLYSGRRWSCQQSFLSTEAMTGDDFILGK